MGRKTVTISALKATGARTFRSLRERNYRLFFTGHAVSVVGTWMQRVAQDWLVLQLSDSGVALGATLALQFAPMLVLGMWGGVLVDRFDRRRLIVGTQSAQAALAATLGGLALAGVVELWMVYALALLLGFVTVVDVPARHAFIGDMVGPADYVNAQSLNSTVHNAGRLVGPALAGVLIASVGVAAAFLVNAVSFGAVLVNLLRMDTHRSHRAPASGRGQAREGLRYVWAHPELRAALLLVLVVALFGQNFRVVLPMLARDTFGGGAATYGYLTGLLGFGAVAGALVSASRERATSWSLLSWTFAFGIVNLLTAVAPGITFAYVAVTGLGVANIMFNTLARSLLQTCSDPSMHGRVLALHGLVFLGSYPLGAPLLGWTCEVWGARAGFFVAGATALLAAAALLPRVRRAGRAARYSGEPFPAADATSHPEPAP